MVMKTTVISTDELHQQRQSDWLVFDCRFVLSDPGAGMRSYELEHIDGACYVDLETQLSGPLRPGSGRHPLPDEAGFQQQLRQWGITPVSQIVIYDDSFGSIAGRLWWLLRWQGIENAAVLDGGLHQWKKEGKPLVSSPAAVPVASRTQFKSRTDGYYIDADDLLQLLQSDTCHLIDVRAEARFTGIHEPFDKVAGHIPGAVNIPFEDNLELDGRYLGAGELKEVYEDYIKGDKTLVVMCGSGVTACHTVLALEMIGIKDARLYAGSWSEWITDHHRPVVLAR